MRVVDDLTARATARPATTTTTTTRPSTNSAHDTMVTSPEQIWLDLEQIGFVDFSYAVPPSFDDGHPNWIFVKAYKPSIAASAALSDRAVAQPFELDEAA